MDPSSLIFVAIIGVWAAYLVPHWLRRRDELSQSRTTDRFSEGLRVLQRRSRKTRPDRSGDAVLTSPRVVVDADGEFLYIPADRALAARVAADRVAADHEAAAVLAVTAENHAAAESRAAPRIAAVAAEPAPAVPSPAPSTPEAEIPDHPFDLEVAIDAARFAARRRAAFMAVLAVAFVGSWLIAAVSSASAWVALPAAVLLVLHALASRAAGLRSRENLMLLAVQVRSTELVQARPARPMLPVAEPQAEPVVEAPARTPDRVARRAAAVGAQTWDPIPVPPPTYTLKPAVHRPEPAPLPAPAASASGAGPVSRGALPRRAADIERILALESDLDEGYEEPKVVNG